MQKVNNWKEPTNEKIPKFWLNYLTRRNVKLLETFSNIVAETENSSMP